MEQKHLTTIDIITDVKRRIENLISKIESYSERLNKGEENERKN